jgi:hypothetical protein
MRIRSRARRAACTAVVLAAAAAPILPLLPARADTVKATVVQSVQTSRFSPPSPDPSGITYLPGSDRLLIVDSEVEEMSIYRSVDLWEVGRSGAVQRTGNVTRFSKEPTGVAYDPASETLWVSDDNTFRITPVKAGSDGRFGTSDDVASPYLDAKSVGNGDPEGVTVDTTTGDLYLAGGTTRAFYRLGRGPDGRFGTSDDVKGKFDVGAYGLRDMEGIAFDEARQTLVAFCTSSKRLYELDRTGHLLRMIDISAISPRGGGDVAIAPASSGVGTSYWIVLRGVDNDADSNENDGKLFEVSAGGAAPAPTPTPEPTPTPPPAGTPAAFPAVADATVASDATGNLGGNPTLETDNSPVKRFLLRFEVSGMGGKQVTGVRLRLTCMNASSKGGDFRPVTNAWVEGTVNWGNQPAFEAAAAPLASLGPVVKDGTYEVTLPPGFVTGDGTYSLIVTSTSSDGADYWSREKGGSLAPSLLVTVA